MTSIASPSTETAILECLKHIESLLEQILQANAPAGEGPEAPEECRQKRCDYHGHYLRYGGPDMSHVAYHIASDELARRNQEYDPWRREHMNCTPYCQHEWPGEKAVTRLEQQVRA